MFVLIIDDSPTTQCILVSRLQRIGVSARPFPGDLPAGRHRDQGQSEHK